MKKKTNEEIYYGIKCCSLDKDVFPDCKNCPYAIDGEWWEDNTTAERCNDILKEDVLRFIGERTF